MLYEQKPFSAVLVDARNSDWELVDPEPFNSTGAGEVYVDGGKKLAVWGGGSLAADVVGQSDRCKQKKRIKALDMKGHPGDQRRYPCGRIYLEKDMNSREDFDRSGIWGEYWKLPGLKVMFVKNSDFDVSRIEEFFRQSPIGS